VGQLSRGVVEIVGRWMAPTCHLLASFLMFLAAVDLYSTEYFLIGTGNPEPDQRVGWVISLALATM
jgi:hypothetical protein